MLWRSFGKWNVRGSEEECWFKKHLHAGRPAVAASDVMVKQHKWSRRGVFWDMPTCSSSGWFGVFLDHGKDPAMIQHRRLSWTSRPRCVAELTSVFFFFSSQNPSNCWFRHSQCSSHLSDDFCFLKLRDLLFHLQLQRHVTSGIDSRHFTCLIDEDMTKEKSRPVHEIPSESCHLLVSCPYPL